MRFSRALACGMGFALGTLAGCTDSAMDGPEGVYHFQKVGERKVGLVAGAGSGETITVDSFPSGSFLVARFFFEPGAVLLDGALYSTEGTLHFRTLDLGAGGHVIIAGYLGTSPVTSIAGGGDWQLDFRGGWFDPPYLPCRAEEAVCPPTGSKFADDGTPLTIEKEGTVSPQLALVFDEKSWVRIHSDSAAPSGVRAGDSLIVFLWLVALVGAIAVPKTRRAILGVLRSLRPPPGPEEKKPRQKDEPPGKERRVSFDPLGRRRNRG